jgi:hypothetical protein
MTFGKDRESTHRATGRHRTKYWETPITRKRLAREKIPRDRHKRKARAKNIMARRKKRVVVRTAETKENLSL